MVSGLVHWAVNNRLVVMLLAIVLIAVGGYAFVNINVEAYPDPAPAIIEVIAKYPGASAEEVERQVTTPLEVALAGMPGLESTRSKSLFGLAHLRNQFNYGTSYKDARIEVLNRLTLAELPAGVQPTLAPTSPTGEIYRYILRNPVNARGEPVYALHDLKSIQDWTLTREFRRVPRIADVVTFGGQEKRYEVHPDPDRLRHYDITLNQIQEALTNSNANAGGDYLLFPHSVQVVRGLGLLGDGADPMLKTLTMQDPVQAANYLRQQEQQRLREIRDIVLASTNNVPIRIGDIVQGGRRPSDQDVPDQGVVVAYPTRMGQISLATPVLDEQGREQTDEQGERLWSDNPDAVEGIVLLRKGEKSLPALADVKAKIEELNSAAGKLPPGVKLDTFYDRSNLIARTTETVHENLVVGMLLVALILYVFLNDLRSSLIVAINIPLALLFAFAVLYLRGESANLLSLGAVDFGIIVDSSVIMVECIFRRLSTGQETTLSLAERIQHAANEVQKPLFYSTLIMIAALLPLFTMTGPEGQIFGPMAGAYAYSLLGALLLALTLSPMLCRTFLGNVKAEHDNFLVRATKRFYLWQLEYALHHRVLILVLFTLLVVGTGIALPFLGREFMPELEEGNVYVRGTFPASVSLAEVDEKSAIARQELQKYPEVSAVLSQMGRPDDGTDPTGFYNAELFVPLKREDKWPAVVDRPWYWRWLGSKRARTKAELVSAMNDDLDAAVVGVDWNFSQSIRDNVMETLSGVKGENSVKIFGPDLGELERLAADTASQLNTVRGITNVGIFSILGQTNLEFSIDRQKCAVWNVNIADVQDALATAVGGKAFTHMVEGERSFDITIRWPPQLRSDEEKILDIPVDVLKNRVKSDSQVGALPLTGVKLPEPSALGSTETPSVDAVPRRRLRDLITPIDENGERDPEAPFTRSGASTIYREQSQRLIAVKFSVRGRDLASAVSEAQSKTKSLFQAPYASEWSGEFEEMQNAIERLALVASLAMILIAVLLYLALRSLLDVCVVFSNVVVICMGGIFSLFLTGNNFNISAGVGFISILGVGMMNGLLLVSGFNARRAQGMTTDQALRDGVAKGIRPLTMTGFLAIFGMLPAALATKIGSQTQKPLAIVVVGGMVVTLLMINLVPVLYSFYGDREPPEGSRLEH